jgi:hypothetical protein
VSFVTSFLGVGFNLALPIFLIQIQEKQPTSIRNFLNIIWKATSRSFGAIVVLGSLLALVVFMFFFTGSYKAFPVNLNSLYGFSLSNFIFSLILSALLSLFAFTPIYFSLKEQNLYRALISSVAFFFKNLGFSLPFSLLLFTESFAKNILYFYSPGTIFKLITFMLFTEIILLFGSILCLLYFQKSKN